MELLKIQKDRSTLTLWKHPDVDYVVLRIIMIEDATALGDYEEVLEENNTAINLSKSDAAILINKLNYFINDNLQKQ